MKGREEEMMDGIFGSLQPKRLKGRRIRGYREKLKHGF
jgi:hypothetical protein